MNEEKNLKSLKFKKKNKQDKVDTKLLTITQAKLKHVVTRAHQGGFPNFSFTRENP